MLSLAVRAALVASVFVSAQSFANPVMTEDMRLRQVPHTRHVQVSYVSLPSDKDVTGLSRDGTALTPTWTKGTYDTNMGSGVSTQQSRQTCDCDVPVGSHTWELTSPNTGSKLSGTLVVLADAPDLVPADAGNPDAAPWDQPDPVPFQGIDCAATCSPAPGLDASTPAPGLDVGSAAKPDAGEPAKTGGGCTQGLAPLAMGSLAAALFALAGLGLRRRRG